jgi:hypothetical protein
MMIIRFEGGVELGCSLNGGFHALVHWSWYNVRRFHVSEAYAAWR